MKSWLTAIFLLSTSALWAQVIPPAQRTTATGPSFSNPSFEDIARASLPPRGWIDCGFPNESAPDVQPSGAWEVYRPAYHGYTYLGMVTRENDTWESVGQRLSSPLLKDRCYSFGIYLCMSSEYWSAVVPDSIKNRDAAATLPEKNFNKPIKLRIWGGNSYCDKNQLLAESKTVTNNQWEKYTFKLEPNRDWTHVVLEAFYKTPTLFPYNGNLLLDHASDFTVVPCGQDSDIVRAPAVKILQPIEKLNRRLNSVRVNATVSNIFRKEQINFFVNGTAIKVFEFDPHTEHFTTVLMLREGKNNIKLQAINEAGEAQDETSVYIVRGERQEEEVASVPDPPKTVEPPGEKEYKILKKLNEPTVHAGQIIRVDRLYFEADSSNLSRDSSYQVLDELFRFLKENPRVTIEVGGHTSGGAGNLQIDARFSKELSRKRARTVANYLVSKGIAPRRIQFVGYGPTRPIASNNTREGRSKNQRVEIKILSTNG